MPAYAIFDIEVTDPEAYQEYGKLAAAASAKFSPKRVMVSTGTPEKLEGDWNPKRVVVLEFDSIEDAKRWYFSPEYQEAAKVRQRAARTNAVIIESA